MWARRLSMQLSTSWTLRCLPKFPSPLVPLERAHTKTATSRRVLRWRSNGGFGYNGPILSQTRTTLVCFSSIGLVAYTVRVPFVVHVMNWPWMQLYQYLLGKTHCVRLFSLIPMANTVIEGLDQHRRARKSVLNWMTSIAISGKKTT